MHGVGGGEPLTSIKCIAGAIGYRAQRAVFSGIVSIGDQLDVDIADLLDHFALDGKTWAILPYVEAISCFGPMQTR